MQLKNPKKTLKVLYLYMTVPLLLIAMVMGGVWFLAANESKEEDAKVEAAKADDDRHTKSVEHKIGRHCSMKSDCVIGESCLDGHCVNLLKEHSKRQPDKAKPAGGDVGTSGWAAIIAALLGGLTALLGAVTQTVIAFMKARERKRAR